MVNQQGKRVYTPEQKAAIRERARKRRLENIDAHRKYQREYKRSNPKYCAAAIQQQEHWRDLIQRYKVMRGCSRCGFKEAGCALDFHHKDPTTKSFGLSTTAWSKSRTRILEEIKKCILLCANCHRRLEFGDLTLDECMCGMHGKAAR